MEKRKTGKTKNIILCGIVLLVLCLLSIFLGSAKMTPGEFLQGIKDTAQKTPYGVIIYSIRLPRTVGAVVCGMGLGMSGALLQRITANTMASPGLIGVSSGAGFAVMLSFLVVPSLYYFVPLFAFAGAFASTLFIAAISKKIGFSRSTLILVGLAFSSILSAGISLMSLIDTDVLVSYNAFSIGSVKGVKMNELILPSAIALAVLAFSVIFAGKFDLLALGDSTAKSLGLNADRVRIFAMILASASASAAVSFAGLLGFAGLMAPHIARFVSGERMKNLVISSALMGAILVTAADLSGRTLFSPTEVPAGILMALVGAPFFLCLLLFKGGRRDA